MKKLFPYAAVLVPLLLITAWILSLQTVVSGGAPVRLKVTGYDPRDLLAGHYLRYRVVYSEGSSCEGNAQDICLCLVEGERGISSAGWTGPCSLRPDAGQCPHWLSGSCEWSNFTAGIERYYFPEQYSEDLAVVPPEASIEVHLDGQGKGVVSGFFVNDLPLSEFLRLPKATPTPGN